MSGAYLSRGMRRAPIWRRMLCLLRHGPHEYKLVTPFPVMKPISIDDMHWKCQRCGDVRVWE